MSDTPQLTSQAGPSSYQYNSMLFSDESSASNSMPEVSQQSQSNSLDAFSSSTAFSSSEPYPELQSFNPGVSREMFDSTELWENFLSNLSSDFPASQRYSNPVESSTSNSGLLVHTHSLSSSLSSSLQNNVSHSGHQSNIPYSREEQNNRLYSSQQCINDNYRQSVLVSPPSGQQQPSNVINDGPSSNRNTCICPPISTTLPGGLGIQTAMSTPSPVPAPTPPRIVTSVSGAVSASTTQSRGSYTLTQAPACSSGISIPSTDASHSGFVDLLQLALANEFIKITCHQLLSTTCSKEQMLTKAALIAKNATNLCNAYRTAYWKILNPVAMSSLKQSVNDFMTTCMNVGHEIQTFHLEPTERNLQNISLPFLQAIEKLVIFPDEKIGMPQSTHQRNPTSNNHLPVLSNFSPLSTSSVFFMPTSQQSSQSNAPSASTSSAFQSSQTVRTTESGLERRTQVEAALSSGISIPSSDAGHSGHVDLLQLALTTEFVRIACLQSSSTCSKEQMLTKAALISKGATILSNGYWMAYLKLSNPVVMNSFKESLKLFVIACKNLEREIQTLRLEPTEKKLPIMSLLFRPLLQAVEKLVIFPDENIQMTQSDPAVSPSLNVNNPTQSYLIEEASRILDKTLVIKVVQFHLKESARSFATLNELCEAVLEYEEKEEALRKNPPDKSKSNKSATGNSNYREDFFLCKICLEKDIGVVFEPCGHLVSCIECAAKLKQCPTCRQAITKTMRTYLS